MKITHFVGIDVQTKRKCACAIIDAEGRSRASLWGSDPEVIRIELAKVLARDGGTLETAAIGIDSPRRLLEKPRKHFWDGSRRRWRRQGPTDVGRGRHSEIVISAHGLANPQWSPLSGQEQPWMSLGIKLFEALNGCGGLHEVFPSASYKQLAGQEHDGLLISIDLSGCEPGPKDMLDAYVAAATVREFHCGRGCQVGDGDGLGSIVLPRPLQNCIQEVLHWPSPADNTLP